MDPQTVANLLGAGSFLIAVVSALYAVRADQRAKQADRKSERANELATEANSAAVEANQIARDTKTLAERDFQLRNENSDVRWEFRWKEAGLAALTNIGKHEALHVTVQVTVDGVEARGESDTVSPGGEIWIEHVSAGEQYRRDKIARAKQEEQARKAHGIDALFSTPPPLPPIEFLHSVHWRADWRTKLGQPRSKEVRDPLSRLDPDT